MGEKPNYDLDLKPEIRAILRNKRVANSEVDFLRIALDRNKGKEKELLHKTGEKDLLIMSNALGAVPYGKHVKERIDRILSGKTEESFLEKIANSFSSKGNKNETTQKTNEKQYTNKTLSTIKAEIKQSGVNVKELQKRIGANPDGNFGPNSFKKYKEANSNWKKESVGDFISGNTKKVSKKEKGFLENIFDGPDKKEEKNKGFNILNKNKKDKELSNKLFEHNAIMKVINSKEYKNNKERNKAYVRLLNLPENFEKIALELVSKLKSNEKLTPKKTLLLTDYTTNQMYCIGNGKREIIPVYFGLKGITEKHVSQDRKTVTGKIHKFNRVRIAKNRKEYNIKGKVRLNELPTDNSERKNLRYSNEKKAYIGSKRSSGGKWRHNKMVTIVGASVQSWLSDRTSGKYFHIIGPGRNATWGCIGIKFEYADRFKSIALNISKEGGYGLVSKG